MEFRNGAQGALRFKDEVDSLFVRICGRCPESDSGMFPFLLVRKGEIDIFSIHVDWQNGGDATVVGIGEATVRVAEEAWIGGDLFRIDVAYNGDTLRLTQYIPSEVDKSFGWQESSASDLKVSGTESGSITIFVGPDFIKDGSGWVIEEVQTDPLIEPWVPQGKERKCDSPSMPPVSAPHGSRVHPFVQEIRDLRSDLDIRDLRMDIHRLTDAIKQLTAAIEGRRAI